MAIIRRIVPLRLPPDQAFTDHLEEEERYNRITVADAERIRSWVFAKPLVCTGRGFIRFTDGGFIVGDTTEAKTALSANSKPYDNSINLRSSVFKKLLDNHLNPKK